MEVKRWAVECRDWLSPDNNNNNNNNVDNNEEIFNRFLQEVREEEEKQRIQRFYFQKDKNSALLGRLLIYKFLDFCYEFYLKNNKEENKEKLLPKTSYQISRTSKSKPYLFHSNEKNWYSNLHIDFNVSHHGKFVILVGVVFDLNFTSSNLDYFYPFAIGCDLMSVEITGRDKVYFYYYFY